MGYPSPQTQETGNHSNAKNHGIQKDGLFAIDDTGFPKPFAKKTH